MLPHHLCMPPLLRLTLPSSLSFISPHHRPSSDHTLTGHFPSPSSLEMRCPTPHFTTCPGELRPTSRLSPMSVPRPTPGAWPYMFPYDLSCEKHSQHLHRTGKLAVCGRVRHREAAEELKGLHSLRGLPEVPCCQGGGDGSLTSPCRCKITVTHCFLVSAHSVFVRQMHCKIEPHTHPSDSE